MINGLLPLGEADTFDREELFAEVALPVPLDGPLTYLVPPTLKASVAPGARVLVPLGSRTLVGVVVATTTVAPQDVSPVRMRALLDGLDPEPLFGPAMLELCRRVARTYLASWGEVLQVAGPGTGSMTARVRVTEAGRRAGRDTAAAGPLLAGLDPPARDLLARLALLPGSSAGIPLRRVPAGSGVPVVATVRRLAAEGLVEVADEWSGAAGRSWRRAVRLEPEPGLDEARLMTARAPVQRRVIEELWGELEAVGTANTVLEAELAARTGCTGAVLAALEKKGLVSRVREQVTGVRTARWDGSPDGAGSFGLTDHQTTALDAVLGMLEVPRPRPVLLHGVTGSGKTEVYLRSALHVCDRGQAAILMVPEIALTPQLEHRARAVFGDRVAVMHSGLGASERRAAWWKARRGDVDVVVGPRSAVFAPLGSVGLIVVDEEQDGAYKQEERPRYQGREVALERGRIEGAVVLMGSATPSVETYHHAASSAYELQGLPERVASRQLPRVEVVDMREEWRRNSRGLVSEALESAICDRLGRDEQCLVLLNRRGFAAALVCRACGERMQCPDCAVSMTLHHGVSQLRCHYCDRGEPIPDACPECGAGTLFRLGFGTERLQKALHRMFPAARIGRFDADETRRRGAHARILSEFGRREVDVLVGTQMLAKGHDFPGVTLVGVVGADATLGMPDFRAAERTFQLLTQMAGRAGRGDVAGEVVMQAHQPGHYAIDAAVAHDYTAFYEREIRFRKRLGYPPFTTLATCVCRAATAATAREEADHVAAALRDCGVSGICVLGPAAPPIARIRGKHRRQLVVKGPDRELVRDAVVAAREILVERGKLPREWVVDVEPMSMM